MKRIWILTLIALWTFGMAMAQDDLTNHPGYVDLSGIEIPKGAGEVTEVNIGPDLFRMIRGFAGDDSESEMPFGADGMFSIVVKSFDIDEEHSDKVKEEMAKIEKKLQRENWATIVRVKSGDETTNVSVKFEKKTKKTLGLLIMSLEPGNEAAFVNIVGSIPLEALGEMGVNMNENALDSLKQVLGGTEQEKVKEKEMKAKEKEKKAKEKEMK